jgi:hypothetical protein
MRYLPSLLALTLWCCAAGHLQAGISAPIPSARLSADESRILVITHDGIGYSESQVSNPTLSNGKKIDFLSLFSASGVYSWPGKELIYEIEWFCLDYELLASADLNHLARMNRFGNEWALKFYSSGDETAAYTLDQLLTAFRSDLFRPFASWDWHHPWHEEFELVGEKVTLTTVGREIGGFPIGYCEIHTFDIATGSLIETDVRNDKFVALLLGIAGVFLILLTTVVLAIRSRRNKKLAEQGGGGQPATRPESA